MNAVVTAGGRIAGEFARLAGTDIKALASVRGRTMLDRVVAAARGAGCTRIAVVGGAAVREASASTVERFVDESEDGGENVVRALGAWSADEPLLYLTSDLPYANAPAIAAFLAKLQPDAIAMPICSHASFEQRFAQAPPFGISLAGERVVNGGAFYLPAGAARVVAMLAAQFFAARKSPWVMARLLGAPLLARFLTRTLTVSAIEAHTRRRSGRSAQAVRDSSPELAFDVDTLEEYRYARDRE
jgi:GTP:adenosylcobinamide-phosphate guanylyltransferase